VGRDADTLGHPTLPKARQWLDWLSYHEASLPAGVGWAECSRDALIALHHSVCTAARRLRRNPEWDIQGTMTENTEKLEDGAVRWLKRVDALDRRDVPARFVPLLDCLVGALRQQVRLAREIDTMQQHGHIAVEVVHDRNTGRILET
jgi:hypothetical protein